MSKQDNLAAGLKRIWGEGYKKEEYQWGGFCIKLDRDVEK